MRSRGVEDLIAEAKRQGFRVRQTKKGVLIYGKKDGMALIHLTCTDHRAVKNARAALRRLGVQFPR